MFRKILILVILGFILLTFWGNYFNYSHCISTRARDLAFFNQSIRALVYGGELTFTPKGFNILGIGGYEGPQPYRNIHFQPIKFLIAVIYPLFPSPILLFIIQSALVGIGAVPVFLLLVRRFKVGNFNALLAVLLYLFHPYIFFVTQMDFRPMVPAIGLFMWALYMIVEGRLFMYILFAFLVLAAREEYIGLVFALPILRAVFARMRFKERVKTIIIGEIPVLVGFVMMAVYYRYLFNFNILSFRVPVARCIYWRNIRKFLSQMGPGVGFLIFAPEYAVFLFIMLLATNRVLFPVANHFWIIPGNFYLHRYMLLYIIYFAGFIVGIGRSWSCVCRFRRFRRIFSVVFAIVLTGILWTYHPEYTSFISRKDKEVAKKPVRDLGRLYHYSLSVSRDKKVMVPYELLAIFSSRREVYCYQRLPHWRYGDKNRREYYPNNINLLKDLIKKMDVVIVKASHKRLFPILRGAGFSPVGRYNGYIVYTPVL